ncbi:MAG: hypothetical protein WBB60_06290 [Nitrospira sp.]|nr:hypothetical protein [Nitrospira sp.]
MTPVRFAGLLAASLLDGLAVNMQFVRIVVAKYGLNWVGLLGRMR